VSGVRPCGLLGPAPEDCSDREPAPMARTARPPGARHTPYDGLTDP